MVEVLNGTRRTGLARRGARVLRRAGFDVVFFGAADTVPAASAVLVRRGSLADGVRAARALALDTTLVRSAPDTLRRVDVTVVLGGDWEAPADGRP